MKFMNTYDIDDAMLRYAGHPILGPATRTLHHLAQWANNNSDGWHSWPKPCRAARLLQEMIERDGTGKYRFGDRDDVTLAEYRKALSPIKAFRTKYHATFEIEEL